MTFENSVDDTGGRLRRRSLEGHSEVDSKRGERCTRGRSVWRSVRDIYFIRFLKRI